MPAALRSRNARTLKDSFRVKKKGTPSLQSPAHKSLVEPHSPSKRAACKKLIELQSPSKSAACKSLEVPQSPSKRAACEKLIELQSPSKRAAPKSLEVPQSPLTRSASKKLIEPQSPSKSAVRKSLIKLLSQSKRAACEKLIELQSPSKSAACKSLEVPQSPSKRAACEKLIELQSPSKRAAPKSLKIPQSPLTRSASKKLIVPQSPSKSAARKSLINLLSPSKTAAYKNLEEPQSPTKRAAHKDIIELKSPSKRATGRNLIEPHSPSKRVSIRLFKQGTACYADARKALHTALPDKILCREKEMAVVQKFIDTHVNEGRPGSMYISGPPGTGKTAVLSKNIQRIKDLKKCPIVVYVNCMKFPDSVTIYNELLSELKSSDKTSSLPVREARKQLYETFTSSGPNVVLILDEIDQLDSKNQQVLYTLFEWPGLDNSRLILIGIANSLDLTDRILPRLQIRPKFKPILLNFAPYTKNQLVLILKDRLADVDTLAKKEFGGHSIIEPTAIQFCARKVASVAGDIRKALDIFRRSLEMVEKEVREQRILHQTVNSPAKKDFVPKKITVAHIARTVSKVYESDATSGANHKQVIPLHERIALCTLLMMLKEPKCKGGVQLGKLHEQYIKVCKHQSLSGHTESEFIGLCRLSDDKGNMQIKKAKDDRSSKVTLKLQEKELEHTFQDKVMFSSILRKGLSK